jgi:K+-sensing histidine kinase KdpD
VVRAGFDCATAELTIEVQDNGPGIPIDTVTRLFNRDGLDVQGAGLALLPTLDIVGAHAGTVEVRSSIDGAPMAPLFDWRFQRYRDDQRGSTRSVQLLR